MEDNGGFINSFAEGSDIKIFLVLFDLSLFAQILVQRPQGFEQQIAAEPGVREDVSPGVQIWVFWLALESLAEKTRPQLQDDRHLSNFPAILSDGQQHSLDRGQYLQRLL
jgi:hypothetical protein